MLQNLLMLENATGSGFCPTVWPSSSNQKKRKQKHAASIGHVMAGPMYAAPVCPVLAGAKLEFKLRGADESPILAPPWSSPFFSFPKPSL